MNLALSEDKVILRRLNENVLFSYNNVGWISYNWN